MILRTLGGLCVGSGWSLAFIYGPLWLKGLLVMLAGLGLWYVERELDRL
jgi:hypothetical protein